MGVKRSDHRIFVGKPGRCAFGKQRRRWEDNIKVDIREIGW
jgi:hypothetical protein